jgi:hypothetical protein
MYQAKLIVVADAGDEGDLAGEIDRDHGRDASNG